MTDTLQHGQSAVTWAREHGERFTWWTLTNRYDVTDPRSESAYGEMFRATGHRGERIVVLVPDNMGELRDATRAAYLIDDGAGVEPWYVAGWQVSQSNPAESYLLLHTFPTERDPSGRVIWTEHPIPRPMDMRNWALTPERFYHVKVHHDVTAVEG